MKPPKEKFYMIYRITDDEHAKPSLIGGYRDKAEAERIVEKCVEYDTRIGKRFTYEIRHETP